MSKKKQSVEKLEATLRKSSKEYARKTSPEDLAELLEEILGEYR